MSVVDRTRNPPPRVFFSYAHEDRVHKKWVRSLATKLRQGGVEVFLDQWDAPPGTDVALFMEDGIRRSDFVLVVCTPTYERKASQRSGGVGYEGSLLTSELIADLRSKRCSNHA